MKVKDLDIFIIDGNKTNKLNLPYESGLFEHNTYITNNSFDKSKNDVRLVLYIQNRTHRKKRIDKKWLKKFGVTERKLNCHIDYNMKNICNCEVKLYTTELTDFIKEMKQHRNRIYFENPINS